MWTGVAHCPGRLRPLFVPNKNKKNCERIEKREIRKSEDQLEISKSEKNFQSFRKWNLKDRACSTFCSLAEEQQARPSAAHTARHSSLAKNLKAGDSCLRFISCQIWWVKTCLKPFLGMVTHLQQAFLTVLSWCSLGYRWGLTPPFLKLRTKSAIFAVPFRSLASKAIRSAEVCLPNHYDQTKANVENHWNVSKCNTGAHDQQNIWTFDIPVKDLSFCPAQSSFAIDSPLELFDLLRALGVKLWRCDKPGIDHPTTGAFG